MYRLDLSKEDNTHSQPLMYLMELLRAMLLNYYLFLINKQSHKNFNAVSDQSSLLGAQICAGEKTQKKEVERRKRKR
jgi:hypothetical protein